MENNEFTMALADGSLMRKLIERFQQTGAPEDLSKLFAVLKMSMVAVPGTAELAGEEYAEMIKENNAQGRNAVKFVPYKVKDDEGNSYFPAFSHPDQIHEDYKKKYQIAKLSFLQCMDMAEQLSDVSGIAIDSHTNYMVIKKEFFNIIRQLPVIE